MKMNLFCFYVVKNALFFWNSPPPRALGKKKKTEKKRRGETTGLRLRVRVKEQHVLLIMIKFSF